MRKREEKHLCKTHAKQIKIERESTKVKAKYNKWTEVEEERFFEAVRKFGKDKKKISEYVGKTINQCASKSTNLSRAFAKNPNLKGSDILPILLKGKRTVNHL